MAASASITCPVNPTANIASQDKVIRIRPASRTIGGPGKVSTMYIPARGTVGCAETAVIENTGVTSHASHGIIRG